MSLTLNPEQVANEWTTRVQDRMREIGILEAEIKDTTVILHTFIKIAVEQLNKDPVLSNPNSQATLEMDNEQALQVIDLFLRGVNQSIKRLQTYNMSPAQRNTILEAVAWKLFNLAKMLMSLKVDEKTLFNQILASDKDLKTMMRQSTEEVLKQELVAFEN